MKKVTGCIDVRALGRYNFEFYVPNNITDEEIRTKVEDECDYYIHYDVEDGYKEITETITRYEKEGDF